MADENLNQPVAADAQQEMAGGQVETQFAEESPLEATSGHVTIPVGSIPPKEVPEYMSQIDRTFNQPAAELLSEGAAPAGAVRGESTGSDREPLRGAEALKPTRDYSVPATKSRKLKVGDRYVVNYPRKAQVSLATIKTLTNEPGRHVGVEFDQPIGQYADNGNCNGKCKPGQGLWVHPSHLLTEEEHKAMVAQGEAGAIRKIEEVEELEFDSETGEIKPAGIEVSDGSELNDNKTAAPYSLNPADARAAQEAKGVENTNVIQAPAEFPETA